MLIECHLFVSTIDKLCWGILIICSLVDKRSGPSVDMLVSSETTMLIKLNTATCKEIQLGTFAKNRNIPLGFGLVLHFFFIHQFLAHCGARPQVFPWFVPYISLILWQLHPKILHLGGGPVKSFRFLESETIQLRTYDWWFWHLKPAERDFVLFFKFEEQKKQTHNIIEAVINKTWVTTSTECPRFSSKTDVLIQCDLLVSTIH